ncbi:ARM repeat protein [Fusarium tjaetaba]|uniref:ARM repeat protein n=1 Tax=Fusarium tjaetaba TaxID=1567544 RepID=A0A8H5QIJ5_9HYPO|nr:ARM repeat protein [Fusarium tjaetaba]KAF5615172.1 ARM repeat protein [Fusarium tjaetaba]
MEPKPIEAFGASLQGYYNNKCLSDVVLTGPWKESEDKTIEIKDFDANIVEAMLRFLYSFDYDVPPNTRHMIFHAQVYQIGDKYGIEPLKKQAANKFERVVNEAEVDAGFASTLADTISIVYSTTPSGDRGLRDIVVQSSCTHFEYLMSETSFKEILGLNGDFSADLVSLIHESWEKYCYCKCPSCEATFKLRIDSPGDQISDYQEPKPIFCPICGFQPIQADEEPNWLYFYMGNEMESPPYEEFGASLKKYFNNTRLSDTVIKCGGREFAVHSLILFCHSEYFKKQLDGPWKESSERVIEIMDFDPAVVRAMTLFLYCFDYESPADSSAMIFHARVYQIADKYDIEALKRLAATKYRTSIDAGWEMDSFPCAIELAYTTTPPGDRGLRDIALEIAVKKIGTLMSQDVFCKMLSANADLAGDIIRRLHRESEKSQEELRSFQNEKRLDELLSLPKLPASKRRSRV